MNIKTAIIRWDAVDVKLDNGEKRFGYVVDIDDDGLVVDFGDGSPQGVHYRKIRQLLPSFQKILRQGSNNCNDRKGSFRKHECNARPDPYDHEVVLQLSSKGPYTWFPARMLVEESFEYGYHFVEALIPPDRKLQCVVPTDHVRRPYSFKNLLQCRSLLIAFDQQRVPVPEGFVLSEEVRQEWIQRRSQSKVISVEDGYLYYLRENNKTADTKSPERTLDEIMEKLKQGTEPADCATDADPGCQIPPDINTVIPPEIMIKMLKLLNTEQQTKARRVCARWNTWLHLPEFVNKVWIDVPEMGMERADGGRYYSHAEDWGRKVAAGIHATVTKETCLILTGSALPPDCAVHFNMGMAGILGILDGISRTTGITPIKTLAVSDCELSSSYLGDGRPSTFTFLTKGCLIKHFERLILRNVVLIDIDCSLAQGNARNYDEVYLWPKTALNIRVDSACFDLQSPSFACDVWNVLERFCPSVDLEKSVVPAGLKFAVNPNPFDRMEWMLANHAGMILYAFESCDPRASETSRSKYATFLDRSAASFAAVDVRCLNKLTLAMLEKLFLENYDAKTGEFAYAELWQLTSPAYSF